MSKQISHLFKGRAGVQHSTCNTVSQNVRATYSITQARSFRQPQNHVADADGGDRFPHWRTMQDEYAL